MSCRRFFATFTRNPTYVHKSFEPPMLLSPLTSINHQRLCFFFSTPLPTQQISTYLRSTSSSWGALLRLLAYSGTSGADSVLFYCTGPAETSTSTTKTASVRGCPQLAGNIRFSLIRCRAQSTVNRGRDIKQGVAQPAKIRQTARGIYQVRDVWTAANAPVVATYGCSTAKLSMKTSVSASPITASASPITASGPAMAAASTSRAFLQSMMPYSTSAGSTTWSP